MLTTRTQPQELDGDVQPRDAATWAARGSLAVPTLRLAEGVPALEALIYPTTSAGSVLDLDTRLLRLPVYSTPSIPRERVLAGLEEYDASEDARFARRYALTVAASVTGAATTVAGLLALAF